MISGRPIRLLHVDDDPDFADMTAEFLERADEDFTIMTAKDAEEGLRQFETTAVDCIVSDYDIPGQNGIEFLKAVREKYPNLPFILYTGKGSEAVASDAIAAGVTDYLQKESGTSQYTILANQIRNAVERHRQQERAQATRDQLRQIIDKLPQLVFAKDEAGEFLLANEATADAYGTSVNDLEGATDADFADSEEEVELFRADDQAVIESGQPKHIPEETLTTADGKTRLLETTKVPYDPVEMDSDAVLSISTDITERKERKAELEMQSAAMEAAMDGVSILNEDDEYIYMNQAHADIFGYDADELLDSTWRRLYGDDEVTRIEQEVLPVVEDEGEWRGETVGKRRDGTEVHQEITLSLLNDGGLICTNRDITERKEREQKLEQQTEELEQLASKYESQYQTLFEEAPVMTVLTRSEEGRPVIEDYNSLFAETLGYDADTITGSELTDFYTSESARKLESGGYNRSINGEFTREKRDLLANDDEVIEALLRSVPRRTAGGEVIGTVAMYIDITERESVKRTNKRLEEFTSVVSHDLRNPLQVATGGLELASMECDSDYLDDVKKGLNRMEALIEDLLMLAREGREVTDAQPVNLATMIDGCWETVETSQATMMNNATQHIQAERSRLKQVFENLFRNAVEHGGTSVTVSVGELDDGFYIEDDGPGVPSDKCTDIFEAGYSQLADGTGFGLSIVEQIVTAHGWQLRVTDGSDGGARFEIRDVAFATE